MNTINISIQQTRVSGDVVETKIKYIFKKKSLKRLKESTIVFLNSLISYYSYNGYLTGKQYHYLDKYYTALRGGI